MNMREIEAEAEYTKEGHALFERVLRECGECCACGEPLFPKSKHVNIMCLNKVAEWQYPVWGNVLTDVPSIHASAVLCDQCITGKVDAVKHAIEFNTETGVLTYHLVSGLKDGCCE